MNYLRLGIVLGLIILGGVVCKAQVLRPQSDDTHFRIIGYFLGKSEELKSLDYSALTHLIFCFTQLDGNRLVLESRDQEQSMEALQAIKKKFPHLKILVSLGGWSGCKTCPEVFSSESGRLEFAASVREFVAKYKLDGFDMDWESPVIGGKFGSGKPEEIKHFTLVMQALRAELPPPLELCFDANSYRESVLRCFDWKAVMPMVDFVNVMTYGLPNDKRGHTGHHTALYSSEFQQESVHSGVQLLDSLGVPRSKLIIGAGFYGFRVQHVDSLRGGLGRRGTSSSDVTYRNIVTQYTAARGYEAYWDSVSMAPYLYSQKERSFITYDNVRSCQLKTRYALDQKLGGIMFWKLNGDTSDQELLRAISKEAHRTR